MNNSYETQQVYFNEVSEDYFNIKDIPRSSLNILQLAVIHNLPKVIDYIFYDHRVQQSDKSFGKVDGRYIFNNYDEEDESMTLKFAIQYHDETYMLSRLWDYYRFYSEKNLKTIVQFARYLNKTKHLNYILTSWTTKVIFSNSSSQFRDEFLSYYDSRAEGY